MTVIQDTATRTYGPYARLAPIPRDLEGVTAEWLGGLLANRYPGLCIETMETVDLHNSHTTNLRVAVTYNDAGKAAGLPEHLCLKANWSGQIINNNTDICELEARFYYEAGSMPPLPAARCYYADWDGDGSGQGVVVLEDLGDAGGRFGHSTDLLGIEGVARALEDLAKLHGAWWGDERLGQLAWLPRSMDTPVDTDQIALMRPYVDANLKSGIYNDVLPPWIVEDHSRLDRVYAKLNKWAREQPGPFCLVHGDSHMGNTYIYPDGHRIWFDWQLCRVGHGMRDVNYFMIASLTIEERRAADRQLLDHYRQALIATGVRDVPDRDVMWDHFRRWPVYGIQAWLQVEEWWGQNGRPPTERFSAAIIDYDSAGLLGA